MDVDIDHWVASLAARPGRAPSEARLRQLRSDVSLVARLAGLEPALPAAPAVTDRELAQLLRSSGYPLTTQRRVTAVWQSFSTWRQAGTSRSVDERTGRSAAPSYDAAAAEQMYSLAAATYAPPDRRHFDVALLSLLFGTGLTLAEVAALRRRDVDLVGASLIAGNVGARRRAVPFTPAVGATIARLLARAPIAADDEIHLLTMAAPGSPGPGSARHRARALVAGRTPQFRGLGRSRAFRHTYAYTAVGARIQPAALASLLGVGEADVEVYYETFEPRLSVDIDPIIRSAIDLCGLD